MINIIIVLFLAVILFSLEIILPGGILGIFGGIMMLLGVYLTYDEYGAITAALVFVACLVFAAFFFVFQIRILPKLPFGIGKQIYLNGRIEGQSNVNGGGDLVGKEGTVLSRMSPSGTILVEGQRREAISQTGMLDAGTRVTVVGRDAFRLVVRKKED